MQKEKIRELVAQLTLEEKVSLTVGKNSWETMDIERLGIPSIWMSDGPHGLRKAQDDQQDLIAFKNPSVSFPAECMFTSSFDRELIYKLGEELGKECQGKNVQLLLGPGINMKRSPLCGRNFEYMSEDPFLAGEIASSYINGIQSKGVGACVKHFFANNQETRRFSVSAEVSERAIREIYLAAFEKVVKQSRPWAVMSSYNKLNGVQSSENREYLKGVLRDEWGYDGCVISDWGATHNRGNVITGGTDLTMPYENTDKVLIDAVKSGEVSMEDLDEACANVLNLAFKGAECHIDGVDPEMEKGHELVRKVAGESAILLKNENNILPLDKNSKIAFIGGFCKEPRIGGGGSSDVTPTKMTSPYGVIKNSANIIYSPGYKKDGSTTDDLLTHAKQTAIEADVAVLFVGLPASYETEGCDRANMRMPDGHNKLISAVTSVQKNTVVVLNNGSPVEMPWVNSPKGIIEMYLAGEAAGEATCDVLFGDVNPSGRLAETFPIKLFDTPTYLNFPGDREKVSYAEDVYIGYRYYSTKRIPVRFPFGYGLSYTTFRYSNLCVETPENAFDNENDLIKVSVDVTNTGEVAGKEVVQLYVAVKDCDVMRPVKELKGFDKVELQPAETKTVYFELDKRAFSYWNTDPWNKEKGYFRLAGGEFEIQIGKSCVEYDLSATVSIKGEPDRFFHPIIDDDKASRYLETEYGRNYLEERREIIERASGMKMEEYLDTHSVFELRILTLELPYMPWNQVIDICNNRYGV